LAVIRARRPRSIDSPVWHAAAERRASPARRIAPLEPSPEEPMKRLPCCCVRLSRAERGMTLLEIMIVLAILALVMGLVVGPKLMDYFRHARIETTQLKLELYANQAFPAWAMAHPQAMCPEQLADLAEYANGRDANDAWGNPIKMLCGAALPRGAHHIALVSVGPDGKDGTSDDLTSWQPPRD
jgi:prepilin-type N-terminal cleavage/methylation domain-containing protein